MVSNDISIEVLRELIILKEQREQLVNDLEQLDNEIGALTSGRRTPARKNKVTKKAARKKAAKKSGGRRKGGISNKVITALKAAGAEGMTVSDLAKKLKVNPQNLFVWFSGTGKNTTEIKKVGKAQYAYIEK